VSSGQTPSENRICAVTEIPHLNKTKIELLFEHILNAPLLVWVLLGFSLSYLLFFVYPVFLSSPVMQFFRHVPANDLIGDDLKLNLSYSELWFVAKQTPFIEGNLYPPLSRVLFAPLLLVTFSCAYKIVTLVSVFCYVMITLVLPLRIRKERQVSPLLMLVFITGLFSYGFQFELERGQFNLIAMFMCFLAIWIYHCHNRYRYLAYVLFTVSVQLKIYPLIFIVMLISNWQDWKNNIKRFSMLAAVNLALFFVLGPYVFVNFVKAVLLSSVHPFVWVFNHSIRSFVIVYSKIAQDHGWVGVNQYSHLAQIALLAIISVCIFLILLQTYRQKQKGINPLLLLACTLGALLIPPLSHDYKLSILAAPVAILFLNDTLRENTRGTCLRIIFIVLILIFSAAYSSTLFSYTNKPLILQNNFAALLTMLLVITFLSLVSKPSLEGKVSEPTVNGQGHELQKSRGVE
jgi:hypothetical protein